MDVPVRQARYEIWVYAPDTGARTAILTDWRSMVLERTLNSFDTLTLSIGRDDPNIAAFVDDAIIEVRRRLSRPGSQWYVESTLLHRTPQDDFTENQLRIFTSYSRGLNDILRRRHIEYFANTAFTLKSGPGETVMKQFVDENLVTINAVRRSVGTWEAAMSNFSIELDQGRGDQWAGARAWQNLLDVLGEISIAAGVDFSVERGAGNEMVFKCFYPQYGTDRSAIITFDPRFQNMTNITKIASRTEEANAVLVLGQGEEAARVVWSQADATATDASSTSPWRIKEAIRDARSQPTVTELQSVASQALKELNGQEATFSFDVLQTSSRQYGRGAEYWFGDVVKARYESDLTTIKIVGATLSMTEGVEKVDIKLAAHPTPRIN